MVRPKRKRTPRLEGGIAPGFLVAMPTLRDPNFARSVVLVVEHSEEGTIGFVINRSASVTFDEVASAAGVKGASRMPVLTGGPVSGTGWVLFDPRTSDPTYAAESVRVHDEVAITSSKRILAEKDADTSRRALFVGYAGWGAGQLDQELAAGVWLPVSIATEILFACPVEERWNAALRSAGIDAGRIIASRSPRPH